jgi:hypothetical protein
MKRFGSTQLKKWFTDKVGTDSGHKAFLRDSAYAMNSCYVEATVAINTQALVDVLSFSPAIIRVHKVELILGQIIGDTAYAEASKTLYVYPSQKYGITQRQIILQDDIEPLSNTFRQVFEYEYLPAFEQFKDPWQILAFWDSLDEEGKSNHFFSPYKNCKVLILSKMCDDPDFENRCVDAFDFYKKHYEDGLISAKVLMDDCGKVIDYLNQHRI